MRRTSSAPALAALAVLAALTLPAVPATAQQQQGASAGRLELTSSSDVAKREFHQMLFEFSNLRPAVARQHALNAVAADPQAALARVYLATSQLSPNVSAAERAADLQAALASLSSATAAELLLGVYVREGQQGRGAAAAPLIRALAQMVPNDPFIAYLAVQTERAGKERADLVRIQRNLVAKFPDLAIAYNQLAYDLHFAGDHSEELVAVQRYASLAPSQPNPHDTWADLAIMHHRLDEAAAHTQAALRLDSTWIAAYQKLGAIDVARGRFDDARAMFNKGIQASTTSGDRLSGRHWIAVSYAVQGNAKMAVQELLSAARDADAASAAPAVRAAPHQRMALVEALIGDRGKAAAHIEHGRAIVGTPALQTWHAAIVQAALGDTAAARATLSDFAAAPNVSAAITATLRAFVEVSAKNYAAAEAALAGSAPDDLLAMAVRAEVLKSQGKKAEAQKLRDEILGAVLKQNNNAPVDVVKLVARLRAAKL